MQLKISLEGEDDILKKLQSKASEQKMLDTTAPKVENKNKEISGFKLVAGYSSDEGEDEDNNSESEFETSKIEEKPCSTLFPIQERASLEQLKALEETIPVVENETIDTKLFQRKRKIDIDVVNAQNKPKPIKTLDSERHTGFGYKFSSYTDLLGFKSGGIMFAKNEESSSPKTKESASVEESKVVSKESKINTDEIEETKTTLCEKLAFLSEGHPTVSPVQTMMIQVEVRLMR